MRPTAGPHCAAGSRRMQGREGAGGRDLEDGAAPSQAAACRTVRQRVLDQLGDGCHRLEPALGGAPVPAVKTPATVHGAVNPRRARYSSMSRMAPIILDRSIAADHSYRVTFITSRAAEPSPHRELPRLTPAGHMPHDVEVRQGAAELRRGKVASGLSYWKCPAGSPSSLTSSRCVEGSPTHTISRRAHTRGTGTRQ